MTRDRVPDEFLADREEFMGHWMRRIPRGSTASPPGRVWAARRGTYPGSTVREETREVIVVRIEPRRDAYRRP